MMYPPPPYPPPLPGHSPMHGGSRSYLWVLIGGLTVVGVLVVGAVGLLVHREIVRRRLPPLSRETTGQKYAEASGAFNTDVPADSPVARQVLATLDRTKSAQSASDQAALIDCYDFDRMYQEVLRQGFPSPVPSSQDAEFVRGLGIGMTRSVINRPASERFVHSEVKRVQTLGDGSEAVAYVREHVSDGLIGKLRYWLRRSPEGRWRIYDQEDLDCGLRVTTIMGAAMQRMAAGGSVNGWASAATQIQKSMQLVMAGQISQADQAMKTIDGVSMPAPLDAARWTAWGVIRSREYRPLEALKALDAAVALNPDIPAAHVIRARALNQLGRYQQAADESRKYLDEMGADANADAQLGDSLAQLKRHDEAADAYRKGLDDDPDSQLNYVGLAHLLPAGHKSELADRLARCKQPYVAFTHLAADAARRDDLETLTEVTAFIRKTRPGDVLLEYYGAMIKHFRHENREAAAMFLRNYGRAAQKDRPVVAREYVLSMLDAGEPIEAYRHAPEPQPAFRQIAARLLTNDDRARLWELVDLRRHDAAGDPWPFYYLGVIHEKSGAFADAADSFEQAYDAASQPGDKTLFRSRLVSASCRAGHGLALYRKMGPQVFEPLANHYVSQRQSDGLAALLAAHRDANPYDPHLPLYEAELSYLRGRYIEAVQTLEAQRVRIEAADQYARYRVNDLLVRCLARSGQADAATAEAKSDAVRGKVNPLFTAIIEANRGDVARADAAMRQLLNNSEDDGYDLADLYADPDLGPALRSPAFAEWRKTHPRPIPGTQPATTQPR